MILEGWGCSSSDRVVDQHAADAGSIPQLWLGIFLPELTFSEDSFTVSVQPCVQVHALTYVRVVTILYFMSEFSGLWKHQNIQHPW